MANGKVRSEARLRFSKEVIALSSEAQRLEAQIQRVFGKYCRPTNDFAKEAPLDEVVVLDSLAPAFVNNCRELREMLKLAGKNIKAGTGFFEE